MVTLFNISAYYSTKLLALKKPVLDNFNFYAASGEIVIVRGANGSGKSTLLKIIAGLIPNKSGVRTITASDIGYVPQLCVAPKWLTAKQFLQYKISLTGSPQSDIDRCLQLTQLQRYKNNIIGTFSQGMVQRLWIAYAFIGTPDLLILDEPFANIDQQTVRSLKHTIFECKPKYRTIVIAQHDLQLNAARIVDLV